MIPIVTPEQMRAVDAGAPEPVEVLVGRAGAAVARAALDLLGGGYGRRVVAVAGPGNNGADGRAAAERLRARGVHVHVVPVDRATPPPETLPRCDLVIDAAYGTGFRGTYRAPDPAGAPVLAVDIPSGVDGATGAVGDGSRPPRAVRTVTFEALKPGLLFGEGADAAGEIEVVEIGLAAGVAAQSSVGLVERADVRGRVPHRVRTAHKWSAAVLVLGGSPGMTGAPTLAARAALRTGAGMVRLAVPGEHGGGSVAEAVGMAISADGWSGAVLEELQRCKALVIGPGLGRRQPTVAAIRHVLTHATVPAVIDADALAAIGPGARSSAPRGRVRTAGDDDTGPVPPAPASALVTTLPGQRAVQQAIARRTGAPAAVVAAAGRPDNAELDVVARALAHRPPGSTVLTPHDGEFALLTGRRPGPDRIADARRLAGATGAVVLLKGPITVVAAPDGAVELVAGDPRLATAGTGDVLSGIIGALLAQGVKPFPAAGAGAWIHARAAERGWPRGLVAGDLPDLIAAVCSEEL